MSQANIARGADIPVELIVFVFIVIISIIGNVVKWLSKMARAQQKKLGASERRDQSARKSESSADDVLRRFLGQVGGAKPAPPGQGDGAQRRPVRPQRPARPFGAPQTERAPTPQRPPRPGRPEPVARTLADRPRRPAAKPTPLRTTAARAHQAPRGMEAQPAAPQEVAPRKAPRAPRVAQPAEQRREHTHAPDAPRQPVASVDWIASLPQNPMKRAILLREILGPPRSRTLFTPR